jgi:hypothetical protein
MEDKEEKINIILRQTNYTYEEADKKLTECHNDPILVIKNYLGIKDKERKTGVSINQEIYKQLREKMNNSIYEYNQKIQNEKVVLH